MQQLEAQSDLFGTFGGAVAFDGETLVVGQAGEVLNAGGRASGMTPGAAYIYAVHR